MAQKRVKAKSFFSLTKNAKYRTEVQFCIFVTSDLGAVVRFTRPFFPEKIRHRYPLYRIREFTPEAIWTRSQRKNVLTPT